MSLAKLTIHKGSMVDGAPDFLPSGESIQALYNPTEYSISSQNSFGEAQVVGLTQPLVQFGGGQSRSLQLELLADTHAYGERRDAHRDFVARLEALLELEPGTMSPPPCRVTWGVGLSFVGVLESLDARYVHFLEDGTAVRARASLRFKELVRPRVAAAREAVVSRIAALQGSRSLPELAQRADGDPRRWREVARAQDVDRPRRRVRG